MESLLSFVAWGDAGPVRVDIPDRGVARTSSSGERLSWFSPRPALWWWSQGSGRLVGRLYTCMLFTLSPALSISYRGASSLMGGGNLRLGPPPRPCSDLRLLPVGRSGLRLWDGASPAALSFFVCWRPVFSCPRRFLARPASCYSRGSFSFAGAWRACSSAFRPARWFLTSWSTAPVLPRF